MVGKSLQKILQKVQIGFAYQLLTLEIEIENDENVNQPKIQTISRLIQMYMAAVEALQSRSDKRYKYFNVKIQSLMKKKHIVQQLHIASTGRTADKFALKEVFKAQIGQRKNDLDLQIFLNKQQFDSKRIRQMMKVAQNQLKTFQKNVNSNLKKQDDDLQQRRKIRKMKSQAGSVSKFDLDNYRKFQSPNKLKTQQQLDEYFVFNAPSTNIQGQSRKRRGSIQKQKLDHKLKNLVV